MCKTEIASEFLHALTWLHICIALNKHGDSNHVPFVTICASVLWLVTGASFAIFRVLK